MEYKLLSGASTMDKIVCCMSGPPMLGNLLMKK